VGGWDAGERLEADLRAPEQFVVVGVSDLRRAMTPEEREIEQQRMIEAYLCDLWCPARVLFGPEPDSRMWNAKPRPEMRWLRNMDLAYLRTLPYAQVLEEIRAA
jgi:hypothetical protein